MHAQGIRAARQTDLAAIQELLAPLEQAGITKKRSRRELSADLQHFTVVERESKVRQLSITRIAGLLSECPSTLMSICWPSPTLS